MSEAGIRALKQNASSVVARAARGETITITDRGRAVARLTPLTPSRVDELIASGGVRPPLHPPAELADPVAVGDGSGVLRDMRDDERY